MCVDAFATLAFVGGTVVPPSATNLALTSPANEAPKALASAYISEGAFTTQVLLASSCLGFIAVRPRRSPCRRAQGGFNRARVFRLPCKDGAASGTVANVNFGCVGIVGICGDVIAKMLRCLEERPFPIQRVRIFSKQAVGAVVKSAFGDITVEPFSVPAARECEIVLLAAPGIFSDELSRQIRGGRKNTLVINPLAWCWVDIALGGREVNGCKISQRVLFADPPYNAQASSFSFWPFHQEYSLKKLFMAVCQTASSAVAEGMADLKGGLGVFRTSAARVMPQIDDFQLEKILARPQNARDLPPARALGGH